MSSAFALGSVLSALGSYLVSNPEKLARLYIAYKEGKLRQWVGEIGADADLQAIVYGAICEEVQLRTGLILDRDNPFSDPSLANALTERTGVTIRSIRDKEIIKQDVAYFAAAQIEERTGVHLSNILDRDALKQDLAVFASGVFSQKTGVPINNILDLDGTKAELREWAKGEALRYIGSDLQAAAATFDAAGIDIAGLMEKAAEKYGVNPNTGESMMPQSVDGKSIMLGIINTALTKQIGVVMNRSAKLTKRTRRQEQVRQAQIRFRERHGNRMHYERVRP